MSLNFARYNSMEFIFRSCHERMFVGAVGKHTANRSAAGFLKLKGVYPKWRTINSFSRVSWFFRDKWYFDKTRLSDVGENNFTIWSQESFILGLGLSHQTVILFCRVEIHVKNMTLLLGMNISTILITAYMSITSSSSVVKVLFCCPTKWKWKRIQ